jgi:hypothetical protein
MIARTKSIIRRHKFAIAIVAAFLAFALIHVAESIIDSRRAAASEKINTPNILIADPSAITYVDPLHIRLPDGRTFRLAYFIGPAPASPQYTAAIDSVWRPFCSSWNKKTGLRTVGVSAAGETLVELWAFQIQSGSCGNTTHFERRAMNIPHWKNLTPDLAASGNFRLQPGITDPDLIEAEKYAQYEGFGIWSDPHLISQVFDLKKLEQQLDSSNGPRHELTVDDYNALKILFRADPAKYAPWLTAILRHLDRGNPFQSLLSKLLSDGGY